MADIRPRPRLRTAAETLETLRLPELEDAARGPGDCRVWASVYLGRDGRILLEPLRLAGAGMPPGYSACLRRLPRLLRREGFPAGLSDAGGRGLRAGRCRRL